MIGRVSIQTKATQAVGVVLELRNEVIFVGRVQMLSHIYVANRITLSKTDLLYPLKS